MGTASQVYHWTKPSLVLPESYRDRVVEESREQLEALYLLSKSISDNSECFQSGQEVTPSLLEEPNERKPTDADWEALSSGVKRFLNTKLYLEFFESFQKPSGNFDVSVNADVSSKLLHILHSLLLGLLRRDIDAQLRVKLSKSATSILQKPKLVDGRTFQPPWEETLELIEEFHIDSCKGSLYIGREIREQHLRSLITLLLCFRWYSSSETGGDGNVQSGSSPTICSNIESICKQRISLIEPESPLIAIKMLAELSLLIPIYCEPIVEWIPEAITIWGRINSSYDWDRLWLRLIGRIAKQHPFVIDWTPYLSFIYDRIFTCFHITTFEGAAKSHNVIKTPPNVSCLIRGDPVSSAAEFICYSLTPAIPVTFEFYRKLLRVIEPFYHPNHHEHNHQFVGSFLSTFSRIFLSRMGSERDATRRNCKDRIPGSRLVSAVASMEHRLTDDYVQTIVNDLYRLAEQCLYSKSSKFIQEAANSIRNLASVCPQVIIPKVLETTEEDLTSLSMPHRTIASLYAIRAICPVLCDEEYYPEGLQYTLRLLPYFIPCVDVNEPNKTKLALTILTALSWNLRQVVQSEPQFFEDFGLQIIDFLENMEAPAKFGHNKISPLNFDTFQVFCEIFFQNCSHSFVRMIGNKIASKVLLSASVPAIKHYGVLIRWITRICPSDTDRLFIEPLLFQLYDQRQPEALLKSISDEEIFWRLRMLANSVRNFPDSQWREHIFKLALAAMKDTSRKIYKAGSRLIRSLLEGLCATTTSASLGTTLTEHWIVWKTPLPIHWEVAADFVRRTLKFVDCHVLKSTSEVNKNDEFFKERLFGAARALHALQRGGRWLLAGAGLNDSTSAQSNTNMKAVLRKPLYAGMLGETNANIAGELWREIFKRVLELLETSWQHFPDNATLLYRVLSPVELGNEAFRFESRQRVVNNEAKAFKQSLQSLVVGKYGPDAVGKKLPVFYRKWRMESLHRRRQNFCAKGGYLEPEIFDFLLRRIMDYCLSDFNKVRNRARNIFTLALRMITFHQRRVYVDMLLQTFHSTVLQAPRSNERIIAAMELLKCPVMIRMTTKYLYFSKRVIEFILQTSKVCERQDVIVCISSLFSKYLANIRPLPVVWNNDNNMTPQQSSTSSDLSENVYNNDITDMQAILDLLSSILSPSESLLVSDNWKVQAFTISFFYAYFRPEYVMNGEFMLQLVRLLAADVMIIRATVQRMVHLILQYVSKKNTREAIKWKNVLTDALSNDTFVNSLLRAFCLDHAVHDSNESISGSGQYSNILSSSALSLVASFFSNSFDAETCWILDGGDPWPMSYFGRPANDMMKISLRHVRFLSRLFSYVDTDVRLQIWNHARMLLDTHENGNQIVTSKVRRLIFGEVMIAMVIGGNLATETASYDWVLQQQIDLIGHFVDADSLDTVETIFRLSFQPQEQDSSTESLHILLWQHLVETFLTSEIEIENSSSTQARNLRVLFALVADHVPKNNLLLRVNRDSFLALVDKLMEQPFLFHHFEQVREEVARVWCSFMLFSNGEEQYISSLCSRVVHNIASTLQKLEQTAMNEGRKKNLSNARHTFALIIQRCFQIRGPLHPIFELKLVKMWLPLLLLAREDSDVDVAAQVTSVLSNCARAICPVQGVEEIMLPICKENRQAPSFKVRGGTVAFFQTWIFFNYLCLEEHVFVELQEILLEYLWDDSIEVREATSRAFISLASLNSWSILEKWSNRFIQLFHSTTKNSEMQEDRIRIRHGAVLGANALILSKPFSIPSWMPSLLVELAYCIHDRPPISSAVRTMFSEFWRSHHDEWSKHKEAFETDQLEAFTELLIAPSYYA
eukprot:jgi/Galph1/1322/GphlegSOOS_G5975.1